MNSMTGYGRATSTLGKSTLTVQVSSVNRRTLDLTCALPDAWESLEPGIQDLVRKSVLRGKIHLAVELTGKPGAADWDAEGVAETLQQLERLAENQGAKLKVSGELLWQVVNSQRPGSTLPSVDAATKPVMQAVNHALRELCVMRAKEGEALLIDFLGRLQALRGHVEAVAARAPQVTTSYREQLLQRLRGAGLELDVSDERVLKEVAIFADRCDITEELTRLRSHLSQLTELLKGDGEIGRKSEFILQEIGREVHTIGSKANDLAIAQRVIEIKNELERVREQMANVE